MKTRAARSATGLVVATLAMVVVVGVASRPALGETKPAAKPPVLVDEFGRVPQEPRDDSLALPDPVLDRTWPGPKPGEGGTDRRLTAPDEDETDPFREKAGEAASRDLPPPVPDDLRREVPPRPLVGPDGKLDAGSPGLEAEPDVADPLELDELEPSEMDREVAKPSALDRGGDPWGEPGDPYDDGSDGGFDDGGDGGGSDGGFGDGGFGGE